MAIRNILQDGDSTLLKTSRKVTDFDKRLHTLLDDMRETLIDANGLGLAAPQVGVLRRVVLIVDINIESDDMEEQIIELINPVILEQSGEDSSSEGCLSFPGIYGIVTRPATVKFSAQDRFGKDFEMVVENITARAVCHEVDHLNGVIFKTLVERYLTEEEIEEMFASREANNEEESVEEKTVEDKQVDENQTS
ncbi:MAG: peptide deformylase [Oscillospiraceae bacterium]|nr:peptide deformylase [Oscillospiraceae bacterium]